MGPSGTESQKYNCSETSSESEEENAEDPDKVEPPQKAQRGHKIPGHLKD